MSNTTRRSFLETVAAAGAVSAVSGLEAIASAQEPVPEPRGLKLKYIVASCMYGYMYLGEILPEIAKCGASHLDLWPKRHGNQREQLQDLGEELFGRLLEKHAVKVGCITQYPLGPFGLQEEMRLAKRLGCELIVTGGDGPKGLAGADLKKAVESVARGHASPRAFYVDRVAEGVATIAAAFWPKPVIVRLSDFKSNEYRKLIGGSRYEPEEENPMLGFRGAARYVSAEFGEAFAMECEAIKRVRNDMGLANVQVMVPFVRTLGQAKKVTELLARHGLERGRDDLKLIMMCEIPSNAILANEFLEYFDGFSIGSNDLTQLTLGLDRDSGLELLAHDFDERDPAVKALISLAIQACKAQGKYIGICGQGPSDHPDFAQWLNQQGISSISLNPDSVISTWQQLAAR